MRSTWNRAAPVSPSRHASPGPRAPMRLGVIGEGLIADALGEPPRPSIHVLPGGYDTLPNDCAAVAVVSDGWGDWPYDRAVARFGARGVAWLPVRAELGVAVIGPLGVPGIRGCLACSEWRRAHARPDPEAYSAVLAQHWTTLSRDPSPMIDRLSAQVVAELVISELEAWRDGADELRSARRLLYVNLRDLTVSVHPFLPDPFCTTCGDAEEDNADSARIVFQPRTPSPQDLCRVRSVADDVEELVNLYVDTECGLVSSLDSGVSGGLVIGAARVALRDRGVEWGYGRTATFDSSRATALLEALERYGGATPGGKRTAVSAAYVDVRDVAVDPRQLGLYPDARYALPDFRFRKFDPAESCRWVWGFSFSRGAPILVPESYAYYRMHGPGSPERPWVYEVSNGCALGSCLEEAVLHGLLEVAERDAFLLTWYASLPVPRIDVSGARDRDLPVLIDAIESAVDCTVMLFDISLDHSCSCVWAMAVGKRDKVAEGHPSVVCAAGSHFVPERAMKNALSELGPIASDTARRYAREPDLARQMVRDPSLVRSMMDHSLLYCHPDSFDRFDFLLGSGRRRKISEMPGHLGGGGTDLKDIVEGFIGSFTGRGLDVIVVDQTTAEHRAGGLVCVKVIVPGTLPMTFGHEHRRTDGLPRLLRAAADLDYRTSPMQPEDVNRHPHPFP